MTSKEYVRYLFFQLISIVGFLFLGLYIYSFSNSGHLESSILKAIIYALGFSTIGLILPCLIFLNKIGGIFYLFKSIGLGFLGLVIGLAIYIGVNFITFGLIPNILSNVIIPGILCFCGLVVGSYFGIKRIKK